MAICKCHQFKSLLKIIFIICRGKLATKHTNSLNKIERECLVVNKITHFVCVCVCVG
jgi:hypothetical protein